MIKRLILLALLVFAGPGYAAGLYPLSNYQQFDANGKLLSGAKLYLFDGGTSTPRIGYKDSSLTAPYPNPIIADASGRIPLIYLADGFYRQRLTTKTGSQVFDQDGIPVLSTTAGGTGTSVDPDSVYKTGDFKIAYNDQPVSGYVRSNGRTIGSASSGATERANADTQPLYEKLWAFSNIAVVGGKGVSSVADFTANKPLTLPNAAGRGLFGMDDLGAGAQSILTTATVPTPTAVGSVGGFQTLTLTQAMLPSYLLAGGSGNVSVGGNTNTESNFHTHYYSGNTDLMSCCDPHGHTTNGGVNSGYTVTGGSGTSYGNTLPSSTATAGSTSINHTHAFSGTTGNPNTTHTHSFSGTGTATSVSINSGGSGSASPNLPPVLLLMIYIRL